MHHLFVYGTLRPGGSNHDLLECATSTVAPATAAGLALYSNASGTYPYATPHPDSQIAGALITVPHGEWPAIVARLDMLEGYDPHTDNGHYLRRRRTIHTGATAPPKPGSTSPDPGSGSAPTGASITATGFTTPGNPPDPTDHQHHNPDHHHNTSPEGGEHPCAACSG